MLEEKRFRCFLVFPTRHFEVPNSSKMFTLTANKLNINRTSRTYIRTQIICFPYPVPTTLNIIYMLLNNFSSNLISILLHFRFICFTAVAHIWSVFMKVNYFFTFRCNRFNLDMNPNFCNLFLKLASITHNKRNFWYTNLLELLKPIYVIALKILKEDFFNCKGFQQMS